jgi:hypothetical protein
MPTRRENSSSSPAATKPSQEITRGDEGTPRNEENKVKAGGKMVSVMIAGGVAGKQEIVAEDIYWRKEDLSEPPMYTRHKI